MKNLIPYLTISNQCEEALLFYKDCFGGEIPFMQKYRETEKYDVTKDFEDKIAHAEFVAEGIRFYASDGFEGDKAVVGSNVGMTITFDDEKEQIAVFHKLKVGGTVTMDFSETSTGSVLATLIDRYGIHWYLDCER